VQCVKQHGGSAKTFFHSQFEGVTK